jgi:SAM-dependent methyltransferase
MSTALNQSMDIIRSVHSRINLNAILQLLKRPSHLIGLPRYINELLKYKSLDGAEKEAWEDFQFCPLLGDRASNQIGYGYYFYQDTWGARQAFITQPESIVDIGSTVLLVGILSQFCPVTSVDVRPIVSGLPGLTPIKGDICKLPFPDASVEYIQSLCVIEHIGLGRYGDPLDPLGSEKAINEVKRVIRADGHFVFSVPIGKKCISFNAQRIFPREQVFSWFEGWTCVDELIIDRYKGLKPGSPPEHRGDHVIGCFHFKKTM